MLATKAKAYWQLTRMNRPIGTLLLLWPTLWSLIIAAQGMPDLDVLVVFVLGVVLMRSAGCVINDFADRKVDGHVKRTKQRPLPSGLVSSKEAVILFLVLAVISFLLVLTMNPLTIKLSFIGVGLAFIYPFMKRFTHLPQLFLGLAFSWAIPMAWAAQTNELPSIVWFIFVINALWTIAYDTQYAMVDRDDDLKIGIKSTAILFGRFDKLIVGSLQLVTLAMLIALGMHYHLGDTFYWALLVAGGLFVYQQHLMRHRDRDLCFQAFLNNNYVGMAVTIGLFITFW
ncbi:4-hydroxybenzoate octaprenyltransferase [Vibrio chagasii]|jgi:4-hydroxybenzoate polyprenyltransferase|uniref:4-hydroxybenzoate octaprenyltransferase n=2 Tax=Vibrio TaxID=662 RepID=A0A2S7V0Y8_9VIBR|nr:MULTISPECIES: 4-hydroxybenzoate octaprenyltransferase [Vibrio]EDK26181.1 4-hydroxybenzoate octaprenyltransferase [Vibrionales bacterium SWAT-3]MDE9383646.1 4-hydroxybenzoate octaprenyltransferase [Vibrio alginolyticus]KAB0475715.1 4-hydroxybenzoate octaprenyltransferase [Vibrio chagasii]MBJ2149006.1 4-hydroxybenzoate octaprenyltransferase [Vibrio sp. IB15]MCG9564317.1 4-hydroxybenzoate octaprenyltransferase [Vibrio chagasii]|tara:strand:+ start:3677 stop:4531 length:855 start_codon:yes stop_codon:yes gene_type:complete